MSLPLAYTLAASGKGSFCGRHSLSNLGHSASYMATSVNQRSQTVLVGPNWWETEFIFCPVLVSNLWFLQVLHNNYVDASGSDNSGVRRNSLEPSDCCNTKYGPTGRRDCWDDYFTYELCCVGVRTSVQGKGHIQG